MFLYNKAYEMSCHDNMDIRAYCGKRCVATCANVSFVISDKSSSPYMMGKINNPKYFGSGANRISGEVVFVQSYLDEIKDEGQFDFLVIKEDPNLKILRLSNVVLEASYDELTVGDPFRFEAWRINPWSNYDADL